MEKLQAALEKARKTRQTKSPDTARTTPGPQLPKRNPDLDALWGALAPFDIASETLEKSRIVTKAANARATQFDILRTKVLLQMRQNGWKRLAITSPMPQSGKTTTACNLALGLGRQQDIRTMVLDLDLRDPSIHKFLEIEPEYGFNDVLIGQVPFEQQAIRLGSNVAFAMAKKPDIDPTRLLLAEETVDVINQIEATYKPGIMIFDLPSILVKDDTRAFLKNVDCALIVARANKSRYAHFDECEREIAENTNVMGVVLNAYRYAD
jgi:Mrp family chromosome partitioning ATPase